MTQFSIIKPDDMHIHFRDGTIMEVVAKHTARQFSRAIIMPNLVSPVVNVTQAEAYYQRIKAATSGTNFEPLMTLYLTDNTTREDIKAAAGSVVKACKLYPAGATTNSDSGVTDIHKIDAALAQMQAQKMPLLIHGEVTAHEVDVFEREAVFIETILAPLIVKFPNLKIVLEHITTKNAVDFVAKNANVFATITAHHLLFNRNDMLAGGIRPHYYCLPILKAEEHRKALVVAALGDSGKFFAGTDSAPHLQNRKEADCGCAGCYTGFAAVEMYAQVFDEFDLTQPKTQKIFENFMSKFGAGFYGLEYNSERITLTKTAQKLPEKITTPEGDIIPLMAGKELNWSVK
jgi:dihydroorotase